MTTSQPIPLDARRELLRREVGAWAVKGYVIEALGETNAQLTMDPPMGCLGVLLTLLTLGLGRVVWRVFNYPHQVYIEVDEQGKVTTQEKLPIYPMH